MTDCSFDIMGLMTDDTYRFTKEEFDSLYSQVPRLTVEIIVKNKNNAIFMTIRAIEPCKGQWHLPGGTVYFGESLIQAVQRVAERELGITVNEVVNTGYIEYPSHYLNGMDDPVGIVFEVTNYKGELKTNNEALDSGWFTKIPDNLHADQDIFLIGNGYLIK
jgi:ADP-ribose pyrophosphatase YjhB (NUDIX family)